MSRLDDYLRDKLTSVLGTLHVEGTPEGITKQYTIPGSAMNDYVEPNIQEPNYSRNTAPPFSGVKNIIPNVRSSLQDLFDFDFKNPFQQTISWEKPQDQVEAERQATLRELEALGWRAPSEFVETPVMQPVGGEVAGAYSNPWEQFGRPAQNPYMEQMINTFGEEYAPMFDAILRWGEPQPGDAYGTTFGGENLSFDPNVMGPTGDVGLFQTHQILFDDLKGKYPSLLKDWGINELSDLSDVDKNLRFTELAYDTYGNLWYGASKTAPGRDDWASAPYEWNQRFAWEEPRYADYLYQ